MFLGIDTGGTFTDFIYWDGDSICFAKVLSTPDDPSQAIMQGVKALGLKHDSLHVVHGSTVATNAILERKGVKTAFVTNQGLRDMLIIGRQTRPQLYELCPIKAKPWIETDDCLTLDCRLDASGVVISDPSLVALHALVDKLKAYDAVAICLLFSFLNPDHEKQLQEALKPYDMFVSLSHQVLSEYREYERGTATFLNAYVGPLVQRYLQKLQQKLKGKSLSIMHSAGGIMSVSQASNQAVNMVLSGPAGGLVAAHHIAKQLNISKVMTFDMGGTSTDVALIHGQLQTTTEGCIADLPLAVPMLDIHTIGAGGGSVAFYDQAGLLHVGPESAGSTPGPVCYGRGGQKPTVTDANLVLGHLPEDAQLGGHLGLDKQAAIKVMQSLHPQHDVVALAKGILQVAEEKMAGALRIVSVQKGYDPKQFSLCSFGGAGGLHACALADALHIPKVIVPLASGAFSAWGMLSGKRQRHLSQTSPLCLNHAAVTQTIEQQFSQLKKQAYRELTGDLSFKASVDVRYCGQGFHLNLDWQQDASQLEQSFIQAHQHTYGHQLEQEVEVVTLRLIATAPTTTLQCPQLDEARTPINSVAHSWVDGVKVPHYQRKDMKANHHVSGPALILEETSTLWLAKTWKLSVSAHGHLMLEKQ